MECIIFTGYSAVFPEHNGHNDLFEAKKNRSSHTPVLELSRLNWNNPESFVIYYRHQATLNNGLSKQHSKIGRSLELDRIMDATPAICQSNSQHFLKIPQSVLNSVKLPREFDDFLIEFDKSYLKNRMETVFSRVFAICGAPSPEKTASVFTNLFYWSQRNAEKGMKSFFRTSKMIAEYYGFTTRTGQPDVDMVDRALKWLRDVGLTTWNRKIIGGAFGTCRVFQLITEDIKNNLVELSHKIWAFCNHKHNHTTPISCTPSTPQIPTTEASTIATTPENPTTANMRLQNRNIAGQYKEEGLKEEQNSSNSKRCANTLNSQQEKTPDTTTNFYNDSGQQQNTPPPLPKAEAYRLAAKARKLEKAKARQPHSKPDKPRQARFKVDELALCPQAVEIAKRNGIKQLPEAFKAFVNFRKQDNGKYNTPQTHQQWLKKWDTWTKHERRFKDKPTDTGEGTTCQAFTDARKVLANKGPTIMELKQTIQGLIDLERMDSANGTDTTALKDQIKKLIVELRTLELNGDT